MASPAKSLRGKHTGPSVGATDGLLAEVSRHVSYRYDLPQMFDGLLLHLHRALDVHILALALPDESRNVIQFRYSRSSDLAQTDLPPELPVDDSPCGTAWTTQKIILVSDVAAEQRWPRLM